MPKEPKDYRFCYHENRLHAAEVAAGVRAITSIPSDGDNIFNVGLMTMKRGQDSPLTAINDQCSATVGCSTLKLVKITRPFVATTVLRDGTPHETLKQDTDFGVTEVAISLQFIDAPKTFALFDCLRGLGYVPTYLPVSANENDWYIWRSG